MEHRHSKRVGTNLRLNLSKRGQEVRAGQVKDASRYGMFVETDPMDFRINQIVEIEYELPAVNGAELHHAFGFVIRKTLRGIGLELEGLDDSEEQSLSDLYEWTCAEKGAAQVTVKAKESRERFHQATPVLRVR